MKKKERRKRGGKNLSVEGWRGGKEESGTIKGGQSEEYRKKRMTGGNKE